MIRPCSNIKVIVFLCILTFVFNACNPARKLREGEHLLHKNYVIDKDTKLDKSDMESYIKQKPNRKILVFFHFHLWLYNLANEDRVKRKRILHDQKMEQKNARRKAKGKKEKKNDRQLFGEWLLSIGEPPVIYDSTLAQKSAKQIKSFLNNKGYFISSVKDSVHFGRRKKADVYYTIKASAPYTINKLEYKIPDELLAYYVLADSSYSLIKTNDRYDAEVMQQERERITYELNNNGYYFFTKDYIYYQVDSTIGNKKVNITLGIKNFAAKYSETSDSIVETAHHRYYLNNIYIQPDFVSRRVNDTVKFDTIKADDYFIIHKAGTKMKYKTKVLLNAIFIRQNELYQLQNVDDSYKRLSELKAFRTINIAFAQSKTDYLDCYIQLSPILKQSFTLETEGTYTSGNPGASASIVYQNRNLMKGAEVFELRLKGGIEAQQVFGSAGIDEAAKQFNTIEFGPELNITTPRFLVPFHIQASKRSNPKTIFTGSLIYQRRPDYTRYITNLSFGYTWKETAKKRHTISPLVINFVKVDLKPDFETYLETQVHDLYTLNSFSNHLSTSTRYTYTFNEGEQRKNVNFSYFRGNLESSGNLLRGFYNVVNSIHENTFARDDQGRYTLLDVVYSQYLRGDVDYRYYYNANDINKIVFRIAAGIGRPLANFSSLPFERSFFSGGANGIRAWQSRTLGPGSYADDGKFAFDQFGDGQLEGNIEYRFKIFKVLSGAFFADGGNTWLRQPNASKPGGDFQFDRFYKEIAIGSGAGVRADFSFFIIRLDVGVKIRDPQFAEDKRWVAQNMFNPEWKRLYRESHDQHKYNFAVFNIGIGYPF